MAPPTVDFTTAVFHAEDRVRAVADALNTPVDIADDDHLPITAAVGAGVVHDPNRLEDVLHHADLDMYAHKPVEARR